MKNTEFREWLRGFFDLSGKDVVLDLKQLQVVINHLNLAEAVEGKLDEINNQLRVDIQALREQKKQTPEDFSALTVNIRQKLL